MTDRQKRAEELGKLEKNSLVNRLIKREEEIAGLESQLAAARKTEQVLRDSMEELQQDLWKTRRRLRLYGSAPVTVLVEYIKETISVNAAGETEVSEPFAVAETVRLREWAIDYEGSFGGEYKGYVLTGTDDDFDDVRITNVISYTTPDGEKHMLEAEEDE